MSVADDLRAAFLTSSLTDEQLAELIAVGEERTFAPGDEIFHEGRPGVDPVDPARRQDRAEPPDR